MTHEWFTYPLLFLAGGISGLVNVLAGGGSFLTLPILIFVGLPPSVANATNRVGVLTQNVAAVWGFHRYDAMPWRWAFVSAIPAVVGAMLGTWAALRISDEAFTRVLAILMVVVTVWTLLHRGAADGAKTIAPATRWWLLLGFFGVGLYGGFVQAGVGFFVLALTTTAGLDLVRGNAVKVLSVLLLTCLSLALFAWSGRVDWLLGLVLGAGNASGAWIGVHVAVSKGHRWLRTFVTVAVVLFAVKLWFS